MPRLAVVLAAALLATGQAASAKSTGVIFVSNERSGDLTVLDGKSLKPVADLATGRRPRDMHFNTDRTMLYVACAGENAIDVIDVAKLEVVGKLATGQSPAGFAIDRNCQRLYVSNEDEASLWAIDMAWGAVLHKVPTGTEPDGVLLSKDGGTVYVASEVADLVHVVDAASGVVRDNIVVATRPRGLAATQDGRELWVSAEVSGQVSIINRATDQAVGKISFLPPGMRQTDVAPVGIVMTRDGKTAFVALGRANRVAIVDVPTRKVIDYVLVGTRPWGLGLSRDEKTLYVVNRLSDDMTVIEVPERRAAASVPVGRMPYGVVVDDLTGHAALPALVSRCSFWQCRRRRPQRSRSAMSKLAGDPRYAPLLGAEDMVLARRDRPFAAAEVALDEAKPLAPVIHRDFALDRITVKSAGGLSWAVGAAIAEKGVRFFVLDLPGAAVAQLGDAFRGKDVLLFNATASDDRLRRQLCVPEIVHTIPSLAMETDAIAQYLVFHKWRQVLLLEGPHEADKVLADAFARSAAKFGAQLVDRRRFRLGNDPRQRDENDVGLLTATSDDYDAVFVADTDGEFALGVPYRTTRPRLVVGSIGLVADAWDWTWERDGGPPLTGRFLARTGRHMTGLDWAVWMATTMVVQANLLTLGGDFPKLRAAILGNTRFDGVKGLAVSVRPWDHQLRQAILLSTQDLVVAAAPLPGFLHETSELDTLGDDRPDTPCHLDRPGPAR